MTRTSAPVFSIVIPAYNSAPFVGAAIRSCLGQRITDLEVIVVDDGSTDATASIVEEHRARDPRLSLIRQDNAGGAAARNRGAAAAQADLITFNDSDDLLMPHYLEGVSMALAADPKAGFAYTGAWVLDDRPRRIRRGPPLPRFAPPEELPSSTEGLLRAMLDGNFISGSRTIRRDAFEGVGGYDANLRFVEDYDLWLRMMSRGWHPARVPERLTILRDRAGAAHTEARNMFGTLALVLGKLSADDNAPVAIRELARRRQQDYEAHLARARRPLAGRVLDAKRRLVMLRRRLRPWGFWYRNPPEEVVAAFGDLARI